MRQCFGVGALKDKFLNIKNVREFACSKSWHEYIFQSSNLKDAQALPASLQLQQSDKNVCVFVFQISKRLDSRCLWDWNTNWYHWFKDKDKEYGNDGKEEIRKC